MKWETPSFQFLRSVKRDNMHIEAVCMIKSKTLFIYPDWDWWLIHTINTWDISNINVIYKVIHKKWLICIEYVLIKFQQWTEYITSIANSRFIYNFIHHEWSGRIKT